MATMEEMGSGTYIRIDWVAYFANDGERVWEEVNRVDTLAEAREFVKTLTEQTTVRYVLCADIVIFEEPIGGEKKT